ncbi:ENHANCER OF AG-4 protein 2-like, partial [Micropterus dolomieu]|uniref:ENHANCER OF AG-4 protein 2-like n=1 Tax=Micropterus dolomieu TaxID=147949 RepID=UPI001E8EECAC
FQTFRREEVGGPVRRRRCSTRRQITFRVSVLRSSTLTCYRSHRDATPPCRVVVPLDLDEQEFVRALQENIPELHFELCRVNGQRSIIVLEEQYIRVQNALGRSCLYLHPKDVMSNPSIPLEQTPAAQPIAIGTTSPAPSPPITIHTSSPAPSPPITIHTYAPAPSPPIHTSSPAPSPPIHTSSPASSPAHNHFYISSAPSSPYQEGTEEAFDIAVALRSLQSRVHHLAPTANQITSQ